MIIFIIIILLVWYLKKGLINKIVEMSNLPQKQMFNAYDA